MKSVRAIIGVLVLLSIAIIGSAQPYPVIITTTIPPPVSAYINQALSGGANSASVTFRNTGQQPISFKIWGKIERVLPSQLKIEINPINQWNILPNISLLAGQTLTVGNETIKKAFADFRESDLQFTPGDLIDQIKAGLNYKLPEGQYTLCLYAGIKDANQNIQYVADRNSIAGCAMFTLCKLSAPQFIQPVNNLNINSTIPIVKPASPITFTWLPPQASCSLPFNNLSYSFEIREILDNQTITDAINNPIIFRKIALRTTTFLLDTTLNKNILQPGKKYAIRVQAEISNGPAPLTIENNGVSRIEAFQYGSDINETAITRANDAESFLIPASERKTGLWDSIYTAYMNHTRGDTLIPVKEYISLVITENGIAYNQDAIELFLALNPGLSEMKTVKLSRHSTLPSFTKVSETERKKFNTEYEKDLLPDINEETIFKAYLDSFHSMLRQQNIASNTSKMLSEVEPHLNKFNGEVHDVNRVSVKFINRLMFEMLRISHLGNLGNSDYTSLKNITSNIIELTSEPPGSSLSMNEGSLQLQTLLCYNNPTALKDYKRQVSSVNYSVAYEETPFNYYFVSSTKQLLPFDVVVWRYSKDVPPKPVSDAPDLNGIYRILYTTSALYNERNPEINAISSSQLASTTLVSLPASSGYYVWGQNMLNHQFIKPQKVEINDAFLIANKKNWPASKNYKIILKVN